MLQQLRLRDVPITPMAMAELSQCAALTLLDLSGARLTLDVFEYPDEGLPDGPVLRGPYRSGHTLASMMRMYWAAQQCTDRSQRLLLLASLLCIKLATKLKRRVLL